MPNGLELSERQKVDQYLARLEEYLTLLAGQGSLTWEDANYIYDNTEAMLGKQVLERRAYTFDELEEKDLPYYSKLVVPEFEWIAEREKQRVKAEGYYLKTEKAQFKAEATARDFIPQLQAMLNRAISMEALPGRRPKAKLPEGYTGEDWQLWEAVKRRAEQARTTPREEAERIVNEVQQFISMGVPVRDLPYYSQVQSYWKGMGAEARALQARNIAVVQADIARRQWEEQTQRQLSWASQMQAAQAFERSTRARLAPMEAKVEAGRRFEAARTQGLERLTEPGDWIEKWLLEHQPSRYPVNVIGGAVPGAFSYVWPMTPWKEPEPLTAPGWLAGITPGLEAGQPITAPGVKGMAGLPQLAPSLEWWGTATPSIKEKARGYAGYIGQSWPDIMARMQKEEERRGKMLPRTPRGMPGGTYWKPIKQRVSRW